MSNFIGQLKIPPAWEIYLPHIASLVRLTLSVLGSAGFTRALTVTASEIEMAVSIGMILVAGIWGLIQKSRADRALQQAAASPGGSVAPRLPS
jgi:hypothetical protein